MGEQANRSPLPLRPSNFRGTVDPRRHYVDVSIAGTQSRVGTPAKARPQILRYLAEGVQAYVLASEVRVTLGGKARLNRATPFFTEPLEEACAMVSYTTIQRGPDTGKKRWVVAAVRHPSTRQFYHWAPRKLENIEPQWDIPAAFVK